MAFRSHYIPFPLSSFLVGFMDPGFPVNLELVWVVFRSLGFQPGWCLAPQLLHGLCCQLQSLLSLLVLGSKRVCSGISGGIWWFHSLRWSLSLTWAHGLARCISDFGLQGTFSYLIVQETDINSWDGVLAPFTLAIENFIFSHGLNFQGL